MDQQFVSKALEANLAETRYKNIVIPEEHQYFIQLSSSYYGINKRASECLIEYSHPFSNRKFVVEELRQILLGDLWFYSGLPEAEKAWATILNVLDTLLAAELKKDLDVQIVQTMAEFIEQLNKLQPKPVRSILLTLEILDRNLPLNEESYIESSRFLIRHLTDTSHDETFLQQIFHFLHEVLGRTVNFWERTSNIEEWYQGKQQAFNRDYTSDIETIGHPWYAELKAKLKQITSLQELTDQILAYDEIADRYIRFIDHWETFIAKFYYSFYLLNLPGMALQKERLIWNINKLLRSAIDEVPFHDLRDFTDNIFELSQQLRKDHISSVLDCLLTLGKRLIDIDNTEDQHLVSNFESHLINFGFESPGMVFIDQDWQINVNENHIKNIRVWLELIEYPHMILENLLSTLIVNLRLGGIFINDTDLFQRDITRILNSNISPFYKKVKQLSRIFPVYFNEIGAEGEIRNVTTSMDELTKRQDRLIHFLRKQVHTESNNTLIELAHKIFNFWYDGDLKALEPILPKDVYDSIDLKGEYFAPVHEIIQKACAIVSCDYHDLLDIETGRFYELIDEAAGDNQRDRERIKYLHQLYFLLKEKYSFDTVDIVTILKRYSFLEAKEIERFGKALKSNNFERSLKMIYGFMEKLKQIIFNPEPSEGWENIYHKRHIAIGIPSMYGVYRESKFEALGLTFRLEKVATRLMEKVVNNINLDYISATTLLRIHDILEYFREGMELDGVHSQGFNSNLQMLRYSLTSRSFSLDQYINIFQFIAEDVKGTIDKYFIKSYEQSLEIVIRQLYDPKGKMAEKDFQHLVNKKSEEFFRDIIASAFLVQPLDNLITKVLNSLRNMVDNLPSTMISDVMSYNSDLVISPIYDETVEMDNQVFLGSKGYFLKKLFLSGFPVPEGFVLTTEVFRRRFTISNHPEISQEFDKMIMNQIRRMERMSERQFGNPKDPLLLSVRSGTAISMPGAMNTFLDVGMNDELTEELSKQYNYGWTSWDSYRRLLQCWGMAHGISRDVFDQTMQDYKKKYNVDEKANFEPWHMKQIAIAYKQIISDKGIVFEQDQFQQLKK
ncbi:MAG: PEP/pyruvate-binding domain-containing protein, partial [Bacteroidales bacterium]|nr:PEP/pyruvate-binding domain-containing protein [Bacteroidales bacterium]